MSFTQLLRILWARRQLVLAVTAGVVVLAVLAYLIMPRTYVGRVSVVIDARGIDPLTGTSPIGQQASGVLATQMDVIASRAVALKVVDELKLADDPALKTRQEHDRARIAAAQSLLQHLTLKPTPNSNVISIVFENHDPQRAADVANGFARAYLQTSVDISVDPAKRQSAWFDQQLKSLRDVVEDRRARLSEYQRSHGITPSEKLDVENARLEEITRQLLEAKRNSQAAGAQSAQANRATRNGELPQVPEILNNALLQTLKADLVRAQAKLALLSRTYAGNHPQYIAASAEVAELKAKIAAEVGTARGSIDQAARIAQQQVDDLQRSFDDQKAHILDLTRQRDEMSVREREVQNAQTAYDTALQRASQLRLESRLSQASVSVLDQATAPQSPSGLSFGLTFVLSLVFGAMFATALAVALELMDRRIRNGDELVAITGLEVLGEVPRMRASFKARTAPAVRGPRTLLESKPA